MSERREKLFKPEEIRLLAKLHKKSVDLKSLPGYFKEYGFDIDREILRFISAGLLAYGDLRYTLGKLTVSELKEMLRQKQVRAIGKKDMLVDKVLSSYTENEVEEFHLTKYYVLTEKGERLIRQNEALLLYYNALSQNYVTAEMVVAAQEKNIGICGADVLIEVYSKRLEKQSLLMGFQEKFGLSIDLLKLYTLKKDRKMIEDMNEKINWLYEEFDQKRKKEAEKTSKLLGISLEERQRLQQEAIDTMDDEWEKELDERNKAKAGIEEA